LDNTQAGIGDTVLVNREGNGARQALKIPDGCVISVIVGIVDSVYLA
jgi:microcompartment protein CcmK/EutM